MDYVSGWLMKFSGYHKKTNASAAFVTTNSVTQGEQVARLWPMVLGEDLRINFAFTSFKWSNLASNKAGVTVAILGLAARTGRPAILFDGSADVEIKRRQVENINPYLVPYPDLVVLARSKPLSILPDMTNGNKPVDGGHLILNHDEARKLIRSDQRSANFIKAFIGAHEAIQGVSRYCLWIESSRVAEAAEIPSIEARIRMVAQMRRSSKKELTRAGADYPHAFQQIRQSGDETILVIPSVSSESREYLPVAFYAQGTIVSNLSYAWIGAPLRNIALLVSK